MIGCAVEYCVETYQGGKLLRKRFVENKITRWWPMLIQTSVFPDFTQTKAFSNNYFIRQHRVRHLNLTRIIEIIHFGYRELKKWPISMPGFSARFCSCCYPPRIHTHMLMQKPHTSLVTAALVHCIISVPKLFSQNVQSTAEFLLWSTWSCHRPA
jgi:hypothetical protein